MVRSIKILTGAVAVAIMLVISTSPVNSVDNEDLSESDKKIVDYFLPIGGLEYYKDAKELKRVIDLLRKKLGSSKEINIEQVEQILEVKNLADQLEPISKSKSSSQSDLDCSFDSLRKFENFWNNFEKIDPILSQLVTKKFEIVENKYIRECMLIMEDKVSDFAKSNSVVADWMSKAYNANIMKRYDPQNEYILALADDLESLHSKVMQYQWQTGHSFYDEVCQPCRSNAEMLGIFQILQNLVEQKWLYMSKKIGAQALLSVTKDETKNVVGLYLLGVLCENEKIFADQPQHENTSSELSSNLAEQHWRETNLSRLSQALRINYREYDRHRSEIVDSNQSSPPESPSSSESGSWSNNYHGSPSDTSGEFLIP